MCFYMVCRIKPRNDSFSLSSNSEKLLRMSSAANMVTVVAVIMLVCFQGLYMDQHFYK